MPTTTVLSRVRGEFFPVMAPGLYVVLAIAAVSVAMGDDSTGATLWEKFKPFVKLLTDYWPLSILVIFAAYLLGNILRAFPVNLSDRICRRWFRRTVSLRDRYFFDFEFPYKVLIKEYVEMLPKYGVLSDKLLPNKEEIDEMKPYVLHTMFNYFKLVLCTGAPDAFVYIQEFELRVRLFSGMFWAGLVGIITNIILAVYVFANKDFEIWIGFIVVYFIISLVLVLLFGRQLPRVRGQEAVHVYLAYFAYMKLNKCTT